MQVSSHIMGGGGAGGASGGGGVGGAMHVTSQTEVRLEGRGQSKRLVLSIGKPDCTFVRLQDVGAVRLASVDGSEPLRRLP